MGDQDPRLARQGAADAGVEEVPPDVGVHGAQRVVEQVHIRIRVHRPGQGHAVPLAPREVDPLLPDLRRVPRGQEVEVRGEGARVNDCVVVLLVVGPAHRDVLAHRRVLDPRLLCRVRFGPPHGAAPVLAVRLPHDGRQEGALAAAHLPQDHHQLARRDAHADVVQRGGALGSPRKVPTHDGDGVARLRPRGWGGGLGFLGVEVILHPLEADGPVDDVLDLHRDHQDGEPQEVEQRQGRERFVRGEVVPHEGVRREGGQGH
mmetsp:Transcript_10332/g.29000  ORF Transcript_10332/g.29000 Transcript_10332/m.29000 type:complete len:261 (-) Transcript_10332:1067-1849(-)